MSTFFFSLKPDSIYDISFLLSFLIVSIALLFLHIVLGRSSFIPFTRAFVRSGRKLRQLEIDPVHRLHKFRPKQASSYWITLVKEKISWLFSFCMNSDRFILLSGLLKRCCGLSLVFWSR